MKKRKLDDVMICPICGERPNKIIAGEQPYMLSCCELEITDDTREEDGKTIHIMKEKWNNVVIEYRKMLALEKIASNQPWWIYTQPTITYPSQTDYTEPYKAPLPYKPYPTNPHPNIPQQPYTITVSDNGDDIPYAVFFGQPLTGEPL